VSLSATLSLLRRTGPAGLLSAVALVLPPIGGILIFSFLPFLGAYLRSHSSAALPIYVGFFWIVGGLALLPTYAYSTLAGFAFGFKLGLAAALTAITGAAFICYLLARTASGRRIPQLLAEHSKWDAVYRYLIAANPWRALGTVTLLRLPPNSPYALGNVLLAAARVPAAPYILGTLLGLAPRTAAVVWFGAGLKQLDLRNNPQSLWHFIIGILITIACLILLSHLARRALARVTADTPSQAAES
jgi:uncharacterized membrane protein YdjX (TVP38/TMEM64 family)